MVLLAQHGWGKSDKIERGLELGSLGGIILSPRDESPPVLETFARRLREDNPGLTVFIDPQYYATTVTNPRSGRLPEYDYFRPEMIYRDFVGATAISRVVRSVVDFQVGLPVSHICAPVIAFDSFGDRWNSIALSMAAEAITYYVSMADERPLLVSFLINENAFRTVPEFEEFLDIVTDFDCEGFYLIVRRTDNEYRQGMDPPLLSSLLYMTHTLGTLNEFDVYFGYCDYLSIPLHAAGATGTACGWTQGLRQFTFNRFEPSTGGRPPRERYSSLPLLNSIFINPELDNIESEGMLQDVLTNTSFDRVLNASPPSGVPWPADISALHHWESLAAGIGELPTDIGPSDRLDLLDAIVTESMGCYRRLSEAGLRLDGASSSAHLSQWERAIAEFRDRSNI